MKKHLSGLAAVAMASVAIAIMALGCDGGSSSSSSSSSSTSSGGASLSGLGNGVNLQPSYYNSGNVNMGWSLMKQYSGIKSVRIEIEPDRVSQAVTWIREADNNGYRIIATYHKANVLGSDNTSDLNAAANWWRSNYSVLRGGGEFLINLMNEWGSHNLSAAAFASAYNNAISTVRQVYSGTIIIDIPGWGQETHIAANAAASINDRNIAFSVHIYPGAWNQVQNRYLNTSDLDVLGNAGRPCLVGEFGSKTSGSADWSALVDRAKAKGWPVMGWCWNGDGGEMNMVTPSWAQNATATTFSASAYMPSIINKLGSGSSSSSSSSTSTSSSSGGCN
ncbi:MAG: cellulase family glycosylhydrolase [Desulfobacteraceae bacterium]|nr:cellulase family glycosylhydrolase [Desulfobacteraceae bacterium]